MDCGMLGFPVSYLPEFAQLHVHWIGDTIQPSHPLSYPSAPAHNLSSIMGLSSELIVRITWPKYWNFSFTNSPSSEYLGLISFRTDWFDPLSVQGTLNSSPAHFKSINSLVLCPLYGPTITSIYDYWKNQSFDYMDFVDKVMSQLFNMLSRLVVTFLSRSKRLLISWL